MGKAEENKQNKKESLLNTGLMLFTSKGFSNTSISDIVNNAGVAKGTFYLYFKDKYDLRNKLIAHKANALFTEAFISMNNHQITDFNNQILYMTDFIVDELNNDKPLLNLISKHLSWGVFRNNLFLHKESDVTAYALFNQLLENSGFHFKDPEIMIYFIIEAASGVIYNPILYEQPATLDQIKPYLHEVILDIIKRHLLPGTSEETAMIADPAH